VIGTRQLFRRFRECLFGEKARKGLAVTTLERLQEMAERISALTI